MQKSGDGIKMSAKTEGFDWLPDYKNIMAFDQEAEFLTTKEVNGDEMSSEMENETGEVREKRAGE